jgi:clan AA aspartic protease (TIGR02281 family)
LTAHVPPPWVPGELPARPVIDPPPKWWDFDIRYRLARLWRDIRWRLRWLWHDVVEWVLDRDPELLACACFFGMMCLVAALAVTLSFLWDNSRDGQSSYAPDPPALNDDRDFGRQTIGPVPPSLSDHGEIKAKIDGDNHCSSTAWAAAAESGSEFPVMLDSGAGASLWLSRGDAARIGIDVGSLKFDERYQGISGAGWSASVTVPHFRLGGLTLDNVPAYVISETDGINQSLVGLPILQRLNYRVVDGQCVLSW